MTGWRSTGVTYIYNFSFAEASKSHERISSIHNKGKRKGSIGTRVSACTVASQRPEWIAYQVPSRSPVDSYLINLDVKDPQAEANILPRQHCTSPLIGSPQQGGICKACSQLAVPAKVIRWASCCRDTMRCLQRDGGNHCKL
jgi:hypothetical protein